MATDPINKTQQVDSHPISQFYDRKSELPALMRRGGMKIEGERASHKTVPGATCRADDLAKVIEAYEIKEGHLGMLMLAAAGGDPSAKKSLTLDDLKRGADALNKSLDAVAARQAAAGAAEKAAKAPKTAKSASAMRAEPNKERPVNAEAPMKSAGTKAAEIKPAEGKPAGIKPADIKPAELKGGAVEKREAPRPAIEQRPAKGEPPAKDVVDKGQPAVAPDRVAALEKRILELEGVLGETQKRMQAQGEVIAAREEAEAKKAKKPSFWRALLEIFEFLARLAGPFFNMLSACVRVARIGFKLLTGKKVEWKSELSRLALDVVGCVPGMSWVGAVGNTAMNVFKNESQILGGANELFDGGIRKDNYFRGMFNAGADAAKGMWSGGKRLLGFGGDEVKEADPTAPATAGSAPKEERPAIRHRAGEVPI